MGYPHITEKVVGFLRSNPGRRFSASAIAKSVGGVSIGGTRTALRRAAMIDGQAINEVRKSPKNIKYYYGTAFKATGKKRGPAWNPAKLIKAAVRARQDSPVPEVVKPETETGDLRLCFDLEGKETHLSIYQARKLYESLKEVFG